MDPEQKKAALAQADQKIADATKALETANASLETAKAEEDDTKVKAATDALTKAQSDVKAATDAKAELEAGDVDDLVDDAQRPPKLNDGTPGDKDISVPKDKFDDLSDKAKLFEQFAPVLAKLKENPAILDRIMQGDDPSKDIHSRMAAIEAGIADSKKADIKAVISDAVKAWPDFRQKWDELKPIVTGLQASGLSYREAVQRAYFAVNPDATKKAARIAEVAAAADAQRRRGEMAPPGGGGAPASEPDEVEYDMSDADKEFVQKTGTDPKLYAKHKDWLERFKDL